MTMYLPLHQDCCQPNFSYSIPLMNNELLWPVMRKPVWARQQVRQIHAGSAYTQLHRLHTVPWWIPLALQFFVFFQGVPLRLFCDVHSYKVQASWSQIEEGFSTNHFTAYGVLLQIFKKHASFYFCTTFKIMWRSWKRLDCFFKPDFVLRIVCSPVNCF